MPAIRSGRGHFHTFGFTECPLFHKTPTIMDLPYHQPRKIKVASGPAPTIPSPYWSPTLERRIRDTDYVDLPLEPVTGPRDTQIVMKSKEFTPFDEMKSKALASFLKLSHMLGDMNLGATGNLPQQRLDRWRAKGALPSIFDIEALSGRRIPLSRYTKR